jgi:copper ion binding protein
MGYNPTFPKRSEPMETRLYLVPGMHCGHCVAAVEEEVSAVSGVESVTADLETKRVEVTGAAADDAAIRAAIEEAGYEAA